MSTDHKAAAVKHIGFVANFRTEESQDWPLVNATVAQAEATLALEAQQKLANQMTYMESLATVMRDGYILSEDRRNDMATLDAAIREGLGLA